jgi:hypothetical protein
VGGRTLEYFAVFKAGNNNIRYSLGVMPEPEAGLHAFNPAVDPELESAWFQPLILRSENLVSQFPFTFNLCRCAEVKSLSGGDGVGRAGRRRYAAAAHEGMDVKDAGLHVKEEGLDVKNESLDVKDKGLDVKDVKDAKDKVLNGVKGVRGVQPPAEGRRGVNPEVGVDSSEEQNLEQSSGAPCRFTFLRDPLQRFVSGYAEFEVGGSTR